MVVVRRVAPKRVGVGVLVWALLVDLCLYVRWTGHTGGIPHGGPALATLAAGVLTALMGLWLGWRRRVGTAFAAPWLAWALLVPFAFASAFVRAGFFSGLGQGFESAIFSGFVAAAVEGVLLVGFATLGRVSAATRRRDRDVVIFPPVR